MSERIAAAETIRSTLRRPRILLLGGTGQLGRELRRTLAPLGDVIAPKRERLDVRDLTALRAAVRELTPALVVNAAAYTAVDHAEAEEEVAWAINAVAPGVLAEEAAACGALLVHYSTDYVFDGEAERPWREDDPTRPLNAYGRTKREGERMVAAAGGPHLVFRIGWVYGREGHNFLRTVLSLAREREELRIVDDQTGAPTWSRLVAEATAAVLAQLRDGPVFCADHVGGETYHLAASGTTTWYGFACAVLAADLARHEHRCHTVVPVASHEYPTLARRPRYSVLDTGKLQRVFGVALPEWREQLALCLDGD
jgi:dTDP-4-dehydrorhamnose reductase